MSKILLSYLFLLIAVTSFGQGKWELAKDRDGIKVYLSNEPGSDYKNVKVVATMTG